MVNLHDETLVIDYIQNIFENGCRRMHTPHPTPGSAPGHKLRKPSKIPSHYRENKSWHMFTVNL